MGKKKRACVTCGLLYYAGYPMSKHRRLCHKAEHKEDADTGNADEDTDDEVEDDDTVEEDDEEDNGADEEDNAEEEGDVFNVESNGSGEDVGDNVNAQRRPQAIIAFKEREVIKFLRMVETGEGMSVAQATDILQWGRSFNDERAQCLPKTLLTCWRIVDKVMFKEYTRALFV
jgi:hypothetical protein